MGKRGDGPIGGRDEVSEEGGGGRRTGDGWIESTRLGMAVPVEGQESSRQAEHDVQRRSLTRSPPRVATAGARTQVAGAYLLGSVRKLVTGVSCLGSRAGLRCATVYGRGRRGGGRQRRAQLQQEQGNNAVDRGAGTERHGVSPVRVLSADARLVQRV